MKAPQFPLLQSAFASVQPAAQAQSAALPLAPADDKYRRHVIRLLRLPRNKSDAALLAIVRRRVAANVVRCRLQWKDDEGRALLRRLEDPKLTFREVLAIVADVEAAARPKPKSIGVAVQPVVDGVRGLGAEAPITLSEPLAALRREG